MDKETKNDRAWEALFEKYKILDKIESQGCYEITSREINDFRESRLMAKFDHYINLPHIFKEHRLAILPITRSQYLIGRFDAYQHLPYEGLVETKAVTLPPELQSIEPNRLYSEGASLHYAYAAGVIDDLLSEHPYYTVSGRMTTDSFSFRIKDLSGGEPYPVSVSNSQCEINAGFESRNTLLLIEAKNYGAEDFLIRQLYYPYRLWSSKIDKQVTPVLLTCSNDTFNFFIYEFTDPEDYNSIHLVRRKRYLIAPEQIALADIRRILSEANLVPEPQMPFPQADKFAREIDLLGLLYEQELTKEEITVNYQFGDRQADYYTNAAIYLGLVAKHKPVLGKIIYALTPKGRRIMEMSYKDKYLSLARCLLEHQVFYLVCQRALELGQVPDKVQVLEIMKGCKIYGVNKDTSTLGRRAQTVCGWVEWLIGLASGLV